MSNLSELRKKIMEKDFSRMNNMQRQAVFCTDGPVLILAGAGSGKTTVLVNRIANLLEYGSAYTSSREPDLSDDELELINNVADGNAEIDENVRAMLADNPAKPWQILAITFTNKAANELVERIKARTGEKGTGVWAATFHATCARILRRFCDRLGYASTFTVYDTLDSKKLIKDCMKEFRIDEKMISHKTILSEISKAKDLMQTPEEYKSTAGYDSRKVSVAKVYKMYSDKLKSANAMDFDDLLYNTVRLFEQNQDVLELYQNQFRYIMVDEYQDTNKVQYKFVSMLAKKSNNICVVGDDDQSIYKFRGATIENILSFEQTFGNVNVIRLEQNYRSTQTILNAANEVITNNSERKGKTLWTQNPSGDKITVYKADSESDEAKYIANAILDGVKNGRKFSDFAILYRMNAQSNAIEQALSRSAVPHRIIGGHRFYDREEIKDMTSYLQFICNPADDGRLKRIINRPKRGIGDSTVNEAQVIADGLGESLFEVICRADEFPTLSRARIRCAEFSTMIKNLIEFANDDKNSISALYSSIIEATNYKTYIKAEHEDGDSRIENIEELKTNIIKYEEENGENSSLQGFLEEVCLITDIDNYNSDADSTIMMTLHSAKGLEFPVVFLPGMEDGIFPGVQNLYNPEDLQEERRLAYVGITRAKEKLFILNARSRMLFGMTQRNRDSIFLREIPEIYVERIEKEKPALSAQRPSAYQRPAPNTKIDRPTIPLRSTQRFKTGDTVMHKTFGKGVILSAVPMASDTMLEIAFEGAATKKLMASFAKLQII